MVIVDVLVVPVIVCVYEQVCTCVCVCVCVCASTLLCLPLEQACLFAGFPPACCTQLICLVPAWQQPAARLRAARCQLCASAVPCPLPASVAPLLRATPLRMRC